MKVGYISFFDVLKDNMYKFFSDALWCLFVALYLDVENYKFNY